jgi:tetratricopeptide (TPR) repeat protein
MLKDSFGLPITTNSPETIAAINSFIDASLSYGKNAEVILEAVTADPTCAIAHAYAATYYLTQESTSTRSQAAPYLVEAQKYLEIATEREQLYTKAVIAWAQGDIQSAIALHEEIAKKYPRDLISVQMGQYHYFYVGNSMRLLMIAEKVLSANRDNHYLYGMIAFGLEQSYRLEEAEAVGRCALEINRHDPWAQHAVAHVMETQGRLDEGITWMESFSDTWESCNSMLFTHNWWHIALYYLEKSDFSKVLALYDQYIWGRATKASSKDQVGAISLLLRLELRGVDVGFRWQELAAYLSYRIYEHTLPFQDLHYVYALAKANQTELLEEMLLSMQAYANNALPFVQTIWREVTIPAARGMVAHAQGDWIKAIAQLGSVLPRLHEVGGSHAQRDLFEQVYLDAWLRNEHNHTALHLLNKRVTSRRFVPLPSHELTLKYNSLGLLLKAS